MAIKIFHSTEGGSDKIWAIDTAQVALGKHRVWYGRRTSRLTTKVSQVAEPWSKIYEKERKGYQSVEGDIIDDRFVPGMRASTPPETPAPAQPQPRRETLVVDWDAMPDSGTFF